MAHEVICDYNFYPRRYGFLIRLRKGYIHTLYIIPDQFNELDAFRVSKESLPKSFFVPDLKYQLKYGCRSFRPKNRFDPTRGRFRPIMKEAVSPKKVVSPKVEVRFDPGVYVRDETRPG